MSRDGAPVPSCPLPLGVERDDGTGECEESDGVPDGEEERVVVEASVDERGMNWPGSVELHDFAHRR